MLWILLPFPSCVYIKEISVCNKKLELDSVVKTTQEEKDEIARKHLTLNDFQEFLQGKARDVARMQRKIERHWEKTFPGEKMLFNDERDIMEVAGEVKGVDIKNE